MGSIRTRGSFWAAVEELNLSSYIGESIIITISTQYGNLILYIGEAIITTMYLYIQYGNFISVPQPQPSLGEHWDM